ncbi:GNAT family N-acetyltransferase [Streptomyces profundus]|uniref:GNAT family N-acetyltransferase n=1 Tax=Streptomyces profundus TaxID=2867410 RepID=UPI001D16ACFB|nr:GNAT family N-acetyltransferase [Streptomyces sp. MA3_2.13]UED85884.1 GNAT family N-acetyltransferase [Streptomyces sp. MA3_2.13]
MSIFYGWRAPFHSVEAEALHAEGFGHEPGDEDWWGRLNAHSLGWVCARRERDAALVGLVNVAWDGAAHAFLLDTVVAEAERSHGVGQLLVRHAVDGARAAGCDWLHVDYEPHLADFYARTPGLRPTPAGLVRLR